MSTLVFLAAALVAGTIMTRAGLIKKQLVVRRPPTRCPSCGRLRRTRVCGYCTRT